MRSGPPLTSIRSVHAGRFHSGIVTDSGDLWVCGDNTENHLGVGDDDVTSWTLTGPSNVTAVNMRGARTYVIDENRKLHHTTSRKPGADIRELWPLWQTDTLEDVTQIVAENSHQFAITSDRRLWASGRNRRGQLGLGYQLDSYTPVGWVSTGLTNVTAVATSATHSLAVDIDGNVWGCGSQITGALGNEHHYEQQSHWARTTLRNIVAVAVADNYSVAVDTDGVIWRCGTDLAADNGTMITRWTAVPDRVCGGLDSCGLTIVSVDEHGKLASFLGAHTPLDDVTHTWQCRQGPHQFAVGLRHLLAVNRDGQLHVIGNGRAHQFGFRADDLPTWLPVPTNPDTYRTFRSLCDDGLDPYDVLDTVETLTL
jgi:alpha-tubulin suppressor-like RCC1 family protein